MGALNTVGSGSMDVRTEEVVAGLLGEIEIWALKIFLQLSPYLSCLGILYIVVSTDGGIKVLKYNVNGGHNKKTMFSICFSHSFRQGACLNSHRPKSTIWYY